MTQEQNGSPVHGRLAAVDVARGSAILGMVAFHLDWDLAHFGYVDRSPAASLPWTILGDVVASVFLALSGYGLVLAAPRGLGFAIRRIALLAAAAGSITAVTLWLYPGEAVLFGILHCIALGNLLALPLRSAPVPILLTLAGLAFASPLISQETGVGAAALWWLGLGGESPPTLDFRPLLPWWGAVLCGIAAARCFDTPRGRWGGRVSRAFAAAGRHSLAIYLVHQPVLFGILTGIAMIVPPPANVDAAFMAECRSRCVATGAGAGGCEAACLCVGASLPSADAADEPTIAAAAARCVSAPRP